MTGRAARTAIITLLLAALAALPLSHGPRAQEAPAPEVPALISADQITYDQNLGIVTASGNVEISQNNRVLLADSVSVNLKTNVVTASGNISLLEPSGDVIFADYAELTNDLQEGFIRDIRVLLSDRSRLAAVAGLRTGGNKTVFSKAVFSPCELCREDPTKAPLWQLKALKVEHDQEDQMIRYWDAWLEFSGVPVFYTPYLEHPDPTVKRKSGLLAPTFGSSDVLGTLYQQPYFWAISKDKDLTIAPFVSTEQGAGLSTRYRQLFPKGQIDLQTSGTVGDRVGSDGKLEENSFRGHVDGTARYDINRIWRVGLDAQRATDDTYLRVYNFSSARTLTSRAFAEGFDGRDYFSANSYLFQGLRATDDVSESPIILPMLDYNYMSDPGVAGGKYGVDANLLALFRRDGRDSRRLSVGLGWELPYTSPMGDQYKLMARVQGDGYWVNGVNPGSDAADPTGRTKNALVGRLFPQLALQWRYPWVRHSETMQQVIEPVVQAVLAPNGSNPGEIPNEDSLDFEFDDTNLFSLNRFTGLDRVDPGSRMDYGLKWSAMGQAGGYSSIFLGQSYRLKEDAVFAPGSGLDDNLSDLVGRVEINPIPEVDLRYRFRIDEENLQARRSELDLRLGPPLLKLNVNYFFVDAVGRSDEFGDREELNWQLNSQLTRYWSAFGGQRLDLVAEETRQVRVGLAYQDECFLFRVVAQRNFFSDREIEPEDSIFFSVVFKHLGGLSSSGGGTFSDAGSGGFSESYRPRCS